MIILSERISCRLVSQKVRKFLKASLLISRQQPHGWAKANARSPRIYYCSSTTKIYYAYIFKHVDFVNWLPPLLPSSFPLQWLCHYDVNTCRSGALAETNDAVVLLANTALTYHHLIELLWWSNIHMEACWRDESKANIFSPFSSIFGLHQLATKRSMLLLAAN